MIRLISAALTVVIGAVLLVHLFYPPFVIDTGTLGLFALLIVVLILPYSKAIHFPGGGSLELAVTGFEKAVEKAIAHPGPRTFNVGVSDAVKAQDGVTVTKLPTEEHAWRSYISQDANIGVAGLRMEIERLLRKLAQRAGVEGMDSYPNISQLTRLLHGKGVLSSEEMDAVMRVLHIGNRAVHGEEISRETAEIIADLGDRVLDLLRSKLA